MIGRRFGRWVVTSYYGRINGSTYWMCQCDCGTEKPVIGATLHQGRSKSCGCTMKDLTARRFTTHGYYANGNASGPAERRSWRSMIERCNNPNHKSYKDYGGRGIRVCERWLDYEAFLCDMGKRPSPSHSIGRIDNDGNYEPSNCRWEDPIQQHNNTRANRILTYKGTTGTLSQLARMNGFNPDLIMTRLRWGWTVDRALSQPVGATKSEVMKYTWITRREKKQNEHNRV